MGTTALNSNAGQPGAREPASIDWGAMEPHYLAGVRSLRDIGKQFGCSAAAILKHAKKHGWARAKPNVVPLRAVEVAAPATEAAARKAGLIYVVYFTDTAGVRFFKIGLSRSLASRLETHQGSLPFDLHLACAYYATDVLAEERALHCRFADKRVRGEWFHLSAADLREVALGSLLMPPTE
jgi:hypothetical protein